MVTLNSIGGSRIMKGATINGCFLLVMWNTNRYSSLACFPSSVRSCEIDTIEAIIPLTWKLGSKNGNILANASCIWHLGGTACPLCSCSHFTWINGVNYNGATIPLTWMLGLKNGNILANTSCIWHLGGPACPLCSCNHFIRINGINYNGDLIAIRVSHTQYQDGLELVVRGPEELNWWVSSIAFGWVALGKTLGRTLGRALGRALGRTLGRTLSRGRRGGWRGCASSECELDRGCSPQVICCHDNKICNYTITWGPVDGSHSSLDAIIDDNCHASISHHSQGCSRTTLGGMGGSDRDRVADNNHGGGRGSEQVGPRDKAGDGRRSHQGGSRVIVGVRAPSRGSMRRGWVTRWRTHLIACVIWWQEAWLDCRRVRARFPVGGNGGVLPPYFCRRGVSVPDWLGHSMLRKQARACNVGGPQVSRQSQGEGTNPILQTGVNKGIAILWQPICWSSKMICARSMPWAMVVLFVVYDFSLLTLYAWATMGRMLLLANWLTVTGRHE